MTVFALRKSSRGSKLLRVSALLEPRQAGIRKPSSDQYCAIPASRVSAPETASRRQRSSAVRGDVTSLAEIVIGKRTNANGYGALDTMVQALITSGTTRTREVSFMRRPLARAISREP